MNVKSYRSRKTLETRSISDDERMAQLEDQVKEAKYIAEDAERKYDEVSHLISFNFQHPGIEINAQFKFLVGCSSSCRYRSRSWTCRIPSWDLREVKQASPHVRTSRMLDCCLRARNSYYLISRFLWYSLRSTVCQSACFVWPIACFYSNPQQTNLDDETHHRSRTGSQSCADSRRRPRTVCCYH